MYKDNAREFLKEFVPILEKTMGFGSAVRAYNYGKIKAHQVSMNCGATRVAILGSDFVVKFDYGDRFNIREFGGCATEYRFYRSTLAHDKSYLPCLMEMSKIKVYNHYYYIMPKATRVGNTSYRRFSAEERRWLNNRVWDLHKGNLGVFNGRAVVIDYACVIESVL